MGTSLIDAANSEYVVTQSLLRPASSLPEVIIYVEGWDDVPFWTECVQPYMAKFRFSIEVFRKPDGCVADGKRHLIESVPESTLGPNLLLAVDADYDWIIDNYKPSPTSASLSTIVCDNDYVLHTYLYSIENYKCYAACVAGLISKATAMTPTVECEQYFSLYSTVVAGLFLAHLVSMDLCDGVYPLKKFCDDLDKVRFRFSPLTLTDNSKRYIQQRLNNLSGYMAQNSAKIEFYKAKLSGRGFAEKDYYLLFKGHSIANTLTKRTLQSLVLHMRKRRISEIKSIPDAKQSQQHIAHYCRITGICENNHHSDIADRIDQLICDCSDVRKARLGFVRLSADLDRLFA